MSSRPRRPAGQNSTTVLLLAWGLRVLGRLSPGLAAAVTERVFFTPPRPRRSRGSATLRAARPFEVRVEGRRIAGWRWGRGPTVALLHGWGGQAGQLTSFVPLLLSRGLSVMALDAPGHGRSSRGLSSAPEFARALRAAADAVGQIHGVVAHSLGGAATALAIRDGLAVERVVLVAPPAHPPDWFDVLARRLDLTSAVVERVRQRSERRLRLRWDELRLTTLVSGFRQPLLVIHDRHDAEVPLADGAAVAAAWPGARLFETSGLGHNRVLRDPEVVAEAVAFLAKDAPATCECGGHAAGEWAACLEQHLFDRDARRSAWGLSPA